MNSNNAIFRLSILSAALLAAFSAAHAQDDEVAQLIKPDSSISAGIGGWSNDRHQQGIYDGMREQGGYGLFDADIAKRYDDSGTWMLFKGRNLGLENRDFRFDVLRQGVIGGFIEYDKTIRDNPYTINTSTQGIGTTELTVGTNRGTFPQREVSLGTDREMFRLGGFVTLVPGLEFKLDFKNELKTGTRQMGRGSAPPFSVEPIHNRIRQIQAVTPYPEGQLPHPGGIKPPGSHQ